MTPEQIALVRSTWDKVVPIASTVATLFYDKLFELDPNVRSLFKSDMGEQKKKLLAMLGKAVAGLDQLDSLVPAVQELGVRHAKYGVKDEDYGTVASALLWTLEQGLGQSWNDEVKEAWTAAYTLLASNGVQPAIQPASGKA